MARAARRTVLVATMVMLGGVAAAGEPVLPAPRPVAAPVVWPLGFERADPYAAWQYYGVDRQGKWRPLVSRSYGEPRYVATGEPFPWAAEHPRYVRSQVSSQATFDQPAAPPLVIVETIPTTGWERMPYAEK